jgi:hypothetical protein
LSLAWWPFYRTDDARRQARTVAAMKAGRVRWLEKLKSEGKRVPCGRKKGGRNRPAEERERAAARKSGCEIVSGWPNASERTIARRYGSSDVQVAADLAMRRERFRAGGPFWTEEELEKL